MSTEHPQFHIYEMNDDIDWWMATGAEEAVRDYTKEIQIDHTECIPEGYPKELSEDDLDRYIFRGEKELGNGQVEMEDRTFRAEMERLIAQGRARSQFFATTND